MTYSEILKTYWGYDDFRGVQKDIIESIGAGRDTLGLMPTGGGKSITFQVPVMLMDGVCLVITPLIALMKDQVRNLSEHGIKAVAIHTGMKREEIITAMENCIYGGYKFLYVSPERLTSELFLTKLKHIKISLITVDESHCISQWGYDFRPSYLKIADIRKTLNNVPVLALTATATTKVVDDIQDKLHFKEKNAIRMSFARENLSYVVRKTENKQEEIKRILDGVPGTSIVYVRNRRETKEIADYLNSVGITADFYHAGLDSAEKDKRQHDWTNGEYRVIIATNAFGMGIDKPDVRTVIHYEMPDSVEAYFQEAGRAGRDGRRSYAVLLYAPGDKRIISKRLSDNFPKEEFIRNIYEKLGFFHEMAVGDGQGCTFSFSLGEFCQHFSLPLIQTESALHILTRMGYIDYVDEMDYSARLRFTAGRDDLYRMQDNDSQTEQILRTILRLYSGIFTDFVYIDEKLICTKTGIKQDAFYNKMIDLQRQGILSYKPATKTPIITWTRPRVETDMLNFDPEVYKLRQKEYKERIGAMTEYVSSQVGCRSEILLHYFGEKQTYPCGQCDLCLEKDSTGLTRGLFGTIKTDILNILHDHTVEQKTIYSLPYKKRDIDTVLQRLMAEEEIYNREGIIYTAKDN